MAGSVKKIFEMLEAMVKNVPCENDGILDLLEKSKEEIREIRASIASSEDEDVLDMNIYRLKNAQEKYKHLLKMAKDRQKKTG